MALSFAAPSMLAFRAPLTNLRMEAPAVEAPPPPPLPKIKTMMVGDQTLAGDMSFDPLMIADTPEKLAWYREAEVKHARLAMVCICTDQTLGNDDISWALFVADCRVNPRCSQLAAFGWPLSEVTNFGNLLTGDGRAPSLLNGGLGEVNGVYWAAVAGLAIYFSRLRT